MDSDEFREADKRVEETHAAYLAWQEEIAPLLPAALRLTNHLHDAKLLSVQFKPEERSCILELDGYYYLEGGDVPARYEIRMEGVTEFAFIEDPFPPKVKRSRGDECCYSEHEILENGAYRWCVLMCDDSEIRFTFANIETKIEPPKVVEYTTYADATKELPELARLSTESSFDFHVSYCFKDLTQPNISLLCCDRTLADVVGSTFEENHSKTRVLRMRGHKMATVQAVLDEGSAVCQFPMYFGDNLDAFDECIRDLTWPGVRKVLLIVFDAEKVLCNEKAEKRDFLFDSIHRAAAAGKAGAAVPTPIIHCVLHSSSQEEMDAVSVLLTANKIPFRSALEYNPTEE